jgi:CBS domain-containing protein
MAAAAATTGMPLADAQTTLTGYAQLGPLVTLLAWLGPINLVIGVFNLIPAFPLDGGRVLRSILWGISGNLRASTHRVSVVGQLFGWAFIAVGIAMTFGLHVAFFGTGLVGGLWLAFIGWFLHGAASQADKRLAIDEALAGHSVEEIMRRNGPSVSPDLSLVTLVHDYLIRSDERAVPVVRDGELLGMVSVSDMRAIPPGEWPTTPVAWVMRPSASLTVASPEEPLAQALGQLAERDIEQLPVLHEGRLVGMLQRRDIARWLELAWKPTARQKSLSTGGRELPRNPAWDPSSASHDAPHAPSI